MDARDLQPDETFLSTPSARRATRPGRCFPADYGISIHALREEGDSFQPPGRPVHLPISIHALRVVGDPSVYLRQ